MPIDITNEIADAIKTNPAVQTALSTLLKGASFSIPEEAIESSVKEIVGRLKIAPAAPKTGVPTNEGIATSLLTQLEAKVATPKGKRVKALATSRAASMAKTKDPVLRFLYSNCAPGLTLAEGKQNVRLCGPAGASKTWQARLFGSAGFDHVIEVQCLSDMEPRDFIAGPTPGEQTKGFRAPFVDGPLAKAWRLAAKGDTVLIILDEVGNVPKSAKQAFQSCLSPYGEYGEEMTKLVTGRAIEAINVNGDPLPPSHADYHAPYIEEIVAPFANISIVGTQNVGSEYDCPEDSPAITARLMPFHVETDPKLIKAAVGGRLKEHFSWSSTINSWVIIALTQLWKSSVEAKSKSLLNRELSLREMMVCVSKIKCVSDDLEKVSAALQGVLLSDGIKTWFVANGHDGRPSKEQVDAWTDLVKARVPVTSHA